MFAGYHSGRSAAGKVSNSITIGNHFMALKTMGKTESVVMILL
jgi:hypothetical protein